MASILGLPGHPPLEDQAPPPPPPPPPQPPRPRRWPAVLGGASLVVASLGAGYVGGRLADDGSTTVEAGPIATSAPAPTTPPPATVPSTVVVPPATADAAAVAAAIVSPAVVQIDTATGLGSGVIYDPSGLILTAAHVIAGSVDVNVRLADGRRVPGRVIGSHDPTDVAVVQIDATDLAVAELALGEDLAIGQLAVAVGSPFGFDQTVTAGIVSAVERTVNNVTMVQTDAAINPGNSGGPLVSSEGKVIGINDLIFSNGGGNEGVGFAIDIDLAHLVAEQLVAGEPVQLALLGVTTIDSPEGQAGALIQSVSAGTAASAAGLQQGDRVVGFDGDTVRDGEDLRNDVIARRPGEIVTIDIVRDGQQLQLDVTLGSGG